MYSLAARSLTATSRLHRPFVLRHSFRHSSFACCAVALGEGRCFVICHPSHHSPFTNHFLPSPCPLSSVLSPLISALRSPCRCVGPLSGSQHEAFFLACFFPTLLTAQNMQLTEQLSKTILYNDIALSPDGAHVAWVQSTAATTSKQTFVRGTTASEPATMVNIASTGERTDSGPAWSPDSKTLAIFSTAGENDQAQLWTVNADGSNPQKLTHLRGYAARPLVARWQTDCLSIYRGRGWRRPVNGRARHDRRYRHRYP